MENTTATETLVHKVEVDEKEETCEMNTSTPVLPLVANGYGHHHDRGLEGKDAVLIHANQTSLNAHLLNESVSRNSKQDVIETLNTKFENERAFRDMEFRLTQSVRDEADRTRVRMFEIDQQRAERERTDGKFAAIEKLISSLITA